MQAKVKEPQQRWTTSRDGRSDEGLLNYLILVLLFFAAERREVLSHVVVDGSPSCGQSACQITCTGRHVRETILQGLALGCEALPSSLFPGALPTSLCRCTLTILVEAKALLALVCPLVRAGRRVAARRVECEAKLNSIIVCDESSFAVLLRVRFARTFSPGACKREGATRASRGT